MDVCREIQKHAPRLESYKIPVYMPNVQATTWKMGLFDCIHLLFHASILAPALTRRREKDFKPTGKIHHTLWIVLLFQHPQLLKMIAIQMLRSRHLRERRANKVREPFRRRTQRLHPCSQCRQRRLHGADPEFVVVLALPGKVHDDRAVGFVLVVRPGRGRRLVKHGFGKGPQANDDAPAPVFVDLLGCFLGIFFLGGRE